MWPLVGCLARKYFFLAFFKLLIGYYKGKNAELEVFLENRDENFDIFSYIFGTENETCWQKFQKFLITPTSYGLLGIFLSCSIWKLLFVMHYSRKFLKKKTKFEFLSPHFILGHYQQLTPCLKQRRPNVMNAEKFIRPTLPIKGATHMTCHLNFYFA